MEYIKICDGRFDEESQEVKSVLENLCKDLIKDFDAHMEEKLEKFKDVIQISDTDYEEVEQHAKQFYEQGDAKDWYSQLDWTLKRPKFTIAKFKKDGVSYRKNGEPRLIGNPMMSWKPKWYLDILKQDATADVEDDALVDSSKENKKKQWPKYKLDIKGKSKLAHILLRLK